MILQDNPIIRCTKCGKQYQIDKNSMDESSYYIGEGGMGEEFQHDFIYEMNCDQCNSFIKFKLIGYEYPVGAINYQDIETDGCEFVFEPQIEPEYLPEQVLSVYEQILYAPQNVYSLEPWEFEELVAEVFQRNGCNAEVTQKTRDGGKDIVASFTIGGVEYKTYFECKKYTPQHPVGVDVVRNLFAVMTKDQIDKGAIVTTSSFTKDAINEAKLLNGRIQLIDFNKLLSLMNH